MGEAADPDGLARDGGDVNAVGRFNRFLKLERERTPHDDAGTHADDHTARASRFDSVETRETSSEDTGSAEGHLARFADPASAEASPALDVADGDQPFLRCARCEGDSHRHASECQHCQADLDTPAQRAFNEAHWKALVEHREQQEAALRATRSTVEDDEARLRKALNDSGRSPLEQLIARRLRQDFEPWTVKLGPVELRIRVLLALSVLGIVLFAALSRGCGA